jgi:hypothetical protein
MMMHPLTAWTARVQPSIDPTSTTATTPIRPKRALGAFEPSISEPDAGRANLRPLVSAHHAKAERHPTER